MAGRVGITEDVCLSLQRTPRSHRPAVSQGYGRGCRKEQAQTRFPGRPAAPGHIVCVIYKVLLFCCHENTNKRILSYKGHMTHTKMELRVPVTYGPGRGDTRSGSWKMQLKPHKAQDPLTYRTF